MLRSLRFRLIGPQQSWGTSSRFDIRDTETAPTKSGVIGILAASLGLPRDADISPLAQLRMGSRTDRAGTWMNDYHAALDVVSATGKATRGTVVGNRAFLADAAFLIAVESRDLQLLHDLQHALIDPHWPIGLGRRSFPPSHPIAFHGKGDAEPIVDGSIEQALMKCPPIVDTANGSVFRYHIEDPAGTQEWFDQPIGTFRERRFRARRVRVFEAEGGSDGT